MKILVTGGAGFLGSHVADALSAAGHEVTVMDIQKSPYIQPNQKMVIGSILEDDFLNEVIKGMDAVYHFAGIADIDECRVKPTETAEINILGTVKLLQSCHRADVKRFIFASTAYVFSNSGSFYRVSKQACEGFIENYHQLYGLEYTCLRYGSLYGTRADMRNSIHRILHTALKEGQIVYEGSGEELREFIHIQDAADISVKILDEEYVNQHVILTGSEKYRYIDLLEMIKEMLADDVEIIIKPSTRKAHYKITPYNFSPKVGKKLVSNPFVDMGQGLLECMAEIYEELDTQREDNLDLFIEDR